MWLNSETLVRQPEGGQWEPLKFSYENNTVTWFPNLTRTPRDEHKLCSAVIFSPLSTKLHQTATQKPTQLPIKSQSQNCKEEGAAVPRIGPQCLTPKLRQNRLKLCRHFAHVERSLFVMYQSNHMCTDAKSRKWWGFVGVFSNELNTGSTRITAKNCTT